MKHAGYPLKKDVVVKWIDSGEVNDNNVEDYLKDVDGILVPGGFDLEQARVKLLQLNTLVKIMFHTLVFA